MSTPGTPKILVNDDPFDKSVAKYERKAAVQQPLPEPVLPPSKEREYEERISRLEDQLATVLYGLANATGTLTCDDPGPGGTLELTFPEPP